MRKSKLEATHPSYTTAHEITATVAPFRAWRGSQFIVAREPGWVTISIPVTAWLQGWVFCGKAQADASQA